MQIRSTNGKRKENRMKRSVKYMTVAAAAVMVMGSFSVVYAEEKCPNCGYLLTGSANTKWTGHHCTGHYK